MQPALGQDTFEELRAGTVAGQREMVRERSAAHQACAGGLRKSSPQLGVVRGIQSCFTGGENGAGERRASFPWRALGAQPSCKPDRGARPFLGGRLASNPGALWVPLMAGE